MKRQKRHIGRVCGAAVLALGLVVGPAVAANADAWSTYSNAGVLRASAAYSQSNKALSVTDNSADGWGARVQYDLIGGAGGSGYLDNTAGANTTRSRTISALYTGIQFRACSINNGIVVGCASAYASSYI